MKTTIYSMDYSKIAYAKGGNALSCDNDVNIGHFDTYNEFPKDIYIKNYSIGYIERNCAYSDYNKTFLYFEDNYIYNENSQFVAYFTGDPIEALALCVVSLALDLITPLSQASFSNHDAYDNSTGFNPKFFIGGIFDGSKGCLGIIAITIISIVIGIYSAEWFFNNFVKESLLNGNIFTILCYIIPLIVVHIMIPVKMYPKLILTKSTNVVFSVMAKILKYVIICAIIAEVATIININMSSMDEINIFLTILAVLPVYWLISLPTSLLAALITWASIKFSSI